MNPAIGGIPLVLGGNVFGWTCDRDASFAVLDAFYEGGGRMIDTADVYSAWIPGHKGGESETLIGQWLESRAVRADMLIHTKTGMMGGKELYEPDRVLRSLDASLERLRTDRIDLYYAHQDFVELPVSDIVAAFDGAVKTGKVKALGASKFGADRLAAALDAAKTQRATPFSVLQIQYNLVARADFSPDLQHLCAEHAIPLLPFFSLANGFLTGKYRSEADLAKSTRGPRSAKLLSSGRFMLEIMDAISAETGASLAQIALAWLNAQPGIGAPIASATTSAQVGELVAAVSLKLDEGQLARLTAAIPA